MNEPSDPAPEAHGCATSVTPADDPTFTTSELAAAAHVGPQTLRYYERRGLLPEPPRTAGGHRIYGPEHLRRLVFVQRAQDLGFALEAVQEMLLLDARRLSRPGETERALRSLEDAVDSKMIALEALRSAVHGLEERLHGDEAPPDTPLESALGSLR